MGGDGGLPRPGGQQGPDACLAARVQVQLRLVDRDDAGATPCQPVQRDGGQRPDTVGLFRQAHSSTSRVDVKVHLTKQRVAARLPQLHRHVLGADRPRIHRRQSGGDIAAQLPQRLRPVQSRLVAAQRSLQHRSGLAKVNLGQQRSRRSGPTTAQLVIG